MLAFGARAGVGMVTRQGVGENKDDFVVFVVGRRERAGEGGEQMN